MSNLMHKVKDAVTNHLHAHNKGSRHDSTQMANQVNDADNTNHSSNMGTGNYGSSDHNASTKMDDKMGGTSNTYGATTTGPENYGSAARDSSMGDTMKTSDNYAFTPANFGGSGGQGSESHHDSSRMTSEMNDTSQGYGSTGAGMADFGSGAYHDSKMSQKVEPGRYSSTQQPSYKDNDDDGVFTMDSDAHGSQNRAGNLSMDPGTYSYTGGYDSGNMETGARRNESMMVNKMDPSVDTNLVNHGTHGATMASTTGPTGQSGGYSSNYGTLEGNAMESGNTGSSDMANQMQNRTEQEIENRSSQQGFDGAAAGGSSYNAPKSTSKRRTSGPHSSNLLNKLDPRVRSSDYEDSTTGHQRGH